MSKLIKVIKLHVGSKSKVFICGYLGLSRNTVKKYIKQFNGLKVTFEELERLSDLVYELFNVQQEGELSPKILDLNQLKLVKKINALLDSTQKKINNRLRWLNKVTQQGLSLKKALS
jgi:predicted transcriptional regulator